MREIKFRGKDCWGNWRYGDLMKNSIPTASPVIVEDFYYDDPDDSMFEVNPATVGQFTGLLDVDGCEIYEGDVVRIDDWSTPSYIRWDDDTASFVVDRWTVNLAHVCYRKVIGNIYDNPELLEVEA